MSATTCLTTVNTMASCIQVLLASVIITIVFMSTPAQPALILNKSLQLDTKLRSAGDRKYIRLKRPANSQHHYCQDRELSCQLVLPKGNHSQIRTQTEKWINLLSLLDYSNITECTQVILNQLQGFNFWGIFSKALNFILNPR